MSSRAVRIAFAALSAASLAFAATACGNGAGDGKITVGLITKTDTNPFFVKMKEGAQQEADAAGVKLLTAAGKFDGDNASQVTAIENMVAAGAQGILIAASDTKAIVPAIEKARAKDVEVIALDTPTDPQSAVDALFATNNFTAGQLIGKYAKAVQGDRPAKIAMIDLNPGVTVGVLRHNGFLSGFGAAQATEEMRQDVSAPNVVCAQPAQGDQSKAQTAMETCLQKDPDINVVYTINEPSALGAYTALKTAGRENNALIVSVDGGCSGVQAVKDGKIAATSQQYPLKMASEGVKAVVDHAKNGKKSEGYTDTGVTLVTAKPQGGVDSKDVQYGLDNCWG
ncbi:sugar ABC transporter substrate-binding protein [Nocardia mexicana]|uniref:Fructose transport system substrate-binding protein n=1 Tax=Nocardia mexicana TaxID=279262 RepID=A0A370HCE3_9NOCA|nr:sugar ABC transporter substrate-binding protein [Nocardia mexicana]RDI54603.1 fructose transport system substrate-binding protein [Nocardia mexicana]